MTGRDAINLVLGGKRSPAQIFRSVLEGESAAPTPNDKTPTPGEKPFPGAKTPYEEAGDSYKPGDRGDEGLYGKNEPGDSPSPMGEEDDDDEMSVSPSPSPMGEEDDDDMSPSPSPKDKQEEARLWLRKMEAEYGVSGGDHDPETQEPLTPSHLDISPPTDD